MVTLKRIWNLEFHKVFDIWKKINLCINRAISSMKILVYKLYVSSSYLPFRITCVLFRQTINYNSPMSLELDNLERQRRTFWNCLWQDEQNYQQLRLVFVHLSYLDTITNTNIKEWMVTIQPICSGGNVVWFNISKCRIKARKIHDELAST